MKKSGFTEEWIVAALPYADEESVLTVARNHQVSEKSNRGWRNQFAGLELTDARELTR